jgi:NAD dependent epimerase/dehydratase
MGKVLVTGADGFIGSHLVEHLVAQGHDVRAFCLYNSFGSWGWLDTADASVKDAVEVTLGDIRDRGCVTKAMEGVDTVFHLAALIGIPYSYVAPDSYVDTNIKGTMNVLDAARALSTRRVLVTSTSEVYGTARYVPIDEAHPRQGQSPYSATKIAADVLAESYVRSFGLPVVTVRPFNTYGPRQSARAVIPTIITQLLSGSKELCLGSLHPTRDLVFVKDTARGFSELARADAALGKDVNIATGEEISVLDLAEMLMDITGVRAEIVSSDDRKRPALSEVERLCGSAARLKECTGWTPGIPLREGLIQTVAWFKSRGGQFFGKAGKYAI